MSTYSEEDHIREEIRLAIMRAKHHTAPQKLTIYGITVTVTFDAFVDAVFNQFMGELLKRSKQEVDPPPEIDPCLIANLTPDQQARFKLYVDAQNKIALAIQAVKDLFELDFVEAMSNINSDLSGVKDLIGLLELEIESGKSIHEAADKVIPLIDDINKAHERYLFLAVIFKSWEHGKELEEWFNDCVTALVSKT